jgi:hypothetical protein
MKGVYVNIHQTLPESPFSRELEALDPDLRGLRSRSKPTKEAVLNWLEQRKRAREIRLEKIGGEG